MKDYSIKASELKSLIRSWRAHGVKPIDTMRVMLLYIGAERYMDKSTGLYLSQSFNQMRKEYKYRDAATLLQVVVASGSFRVVRRREDDLIVAFYSPFVVRDYVLPAPLYETSGLPAGVTGSDSSLFKEISKDILRHVPSFGDGTERRLGASGLEAPVGGAVGVAAGTARSERRDPKYFRKVPLPLARETLQYFFEDLGANRYEEWMRIFYPLHEALMSHGLSLDEASYAIDLYTERRIIPHMECRRGIENWHNVQIAGWVQSFLQPRYLSLRLQECLQLWRLAGREFMEAREAEEQLI
ncbi:MAG: hypothetical protein IJ841_00805 [Prevotella sp.]|nr:hypothetical protein [Prevotella sp.]